MTVAEGEAVRGTKLSCAIYGPMQRQSDASGAGVEVCAIKVTIEFADIMRNDQVLLEQHPEMEEDLKLVTDTVGTQAAADSMREKRLKQKQANIQSEV